MAVRKIDSTVADSRNNVTMPNDATRIDPMKLKLGKQMARHDPRTRRTANAAKTMFTASDQQIVSADSAITGYHPGTGSK